MGCGAGERELLVDLCAPREICARASGRVSVVGLRSRPLPLQPVIPQANDSVANKVGLRPDCTGSKMWDKWRAPETCENRPGPRESKRDLRVTVRGERGMSLVSQRQEVDGDKPSICKFWACSSAEMDLLRGHPSHPRWIAAWARTVSKKRHPISLLRTVDTTNKYTTAEWVSAPSERETFLNFGKGACEGVLVGASRPAAAAGRECLERAVGLSSVSPWAMHSDKMAPLLFGSSHLVYPSEVSICQPFKSRPCGAHVSSAGTHLFNFPLHGIVDYLS